MWSGNDVAALMTIAGIIIVLLGTVAGVSIWHLIPALTELKGLRDLVDKRTKQFVEADAAMVEAKDEIAHMERDHNHTKAELHTLVQRARYLEMGHNSLQLELDSTRAKLACEKEARAREAGIWKDDQNGKAKYIKELEEKLSEASHTKCEAVREVEGKFAVTLREVVAKIENLIAAFQPVPVEEPVNEMFHTGAWGSHTGARWVVRVDVKVGDPEPEFFQKKGSKGIFCRNVGATGQPASDRNVSEYIFFRRATKQEIDAHFMKVMRPLRYRYSRAAGDPDLRKVYEAEILSETAKFEEHPESWGDMPCLCESCKSHAEPG